MRLLHTMLRVGDLDRSIKFYTEVLGMSLLRQSENPEYKYSLAFLGYEGGNPAQAELELTYNYDHGPYVIGDGFAHVALSTPDLEGLHAEHKAKGYEVTDPKGLPGNPPNYYFVKDPDGYKVEVIREK